MTTFQYFVVFAALISMTLAATIAPNESMDISGDETPRNDVASLITLLARLLQEKLKVISSIINQIGT